MNKGDSTLNQQSTVAGGDLHREVLHRLRQLDDAHPERTRHLAIDVAQHGAPLNIPAVQRALEDLWEARQVMHIGRGWRLPTPGVQVQLEVASQPVPPTTPDTYSGR